MKKIIIFIFLILNMQSFSYLLARTDIDTIKISISCMAYENGNFVKLKDMEITETQKQKSQAKGLEPLFFIAYNFKTKEGKNNFLTQSQEFFYLYMSTRFFQYRGVTEENTDLIISFLDDESNYYSLVYSEKIENVVFVALYKVHDF